MDSKVIDALLHINSQFYQSQAASFSATRGRANPGVARLLAGIPAAARVLDLGCGNGSAAALLAQNGFTGEYLGLDGSPGLLAAARQRALGPGFAFAQADLTSDWSAASPLPALHKPLVNYDFVLCFATLHHLPGEALRLALLQKAHAALAPGGQLFLSNWQFLNSPRLAGRVQAWAQAGLSTTDVEPGDYLLDWRGGAETGLRYVHHFSAEELAHLASQTGFEILETFLADGASANLGLYGVWRKVAN